MIALEIHICNQRRSYIARFTTEDQAITFLERKVSTHAPFEIKAEPIPAEAQKLLEWMYPICEHGLSADLCEGPNHYMTAAQEQAMGWDYSDAPAGF